MASRFRSFSALAVLLALGLFQAEVLWASTCAAEMGAVPAAAMAGMETGGGEAMDGAMDDDCPMGEPPHPHQPDGDGSRPAPPCPFTPAGTASCVGGAVLPPATDVSPPGGARHEAAPASSDRAPVLLLAVSLLRPPRA